MAGQFKCIDIFLYFHFIFQGSRVFEDSQRCSIDEEKVWFVKTKASFDKNKLEIRGQKAAIHSIALLSLELT